MINAEQTECLTRAKKQKALEAQVAIDAGFAKSLQEVEDSEEAEGFDESSSESDTV